MGRVVNYQTPQPPDTESTSPVMYSDISVANKAIAPMKSSLVAILPKGTLAE